MAGAVDSSLPNERTVNTRRASLASGNESNDRATASLRRARSASGIPERTARMRSRNAAFTSRR